MQSYCLSKLYKCRALVLTIKACANNQHSMAKPGTPCGRLRDLPGALQTSERQCDDSNDFGTM